VRTDYQIPPFREFPPQRLSDRKQHLMGEVARGPRWPGLGLRLSTLLLSPRRVVVLACVSLLVAVGVGTLVTTYMGGSSHPQASSPGAASQPVSRDRRLGAGQDGDSSGAASASGGARRSEPCRADHTRAQHRSRAKVDRKPCANHEGSKRLAHHKKGG
jgi:hypothetical protein